MKLPDIALLLTLLPLSLAGCDKENGDDGETGDDNADSNQESPDSGVDTESDTDTGGMQAELRWYSTCGDPACGGYNGPWEGVPACGEITEGDPCEVAGETCDFMSDCNAQMICANEDPKQVEGGCPISRMRFKQDIRYLDGSARSEYYRQLLELELATYRYRERSDRKLQLGVILEDNENGVWIDAANDRVDLYGYTSLAIAGVQTQADELAALRSEVEQLRREMAQLRSQSRDHGCQPGSVSRLSK
jgi:hypothetical protein